MIDGQAAHALPPKDAALLAMLALDGPSPRAKVAAMLWPDVDSERAHNSLRQRIFRLRRMAGRDAVVQGSTLALVPGIAHDLIDPQSALDADAAALPGELLGAQGYDDTVELAQWVGAVREQWRAARRDVLAAIAAGHEKADRVATALPYAARLVREEPPAEHAARQLMRLHYRRGDRSAALAAYERLRNALDEQLGETTAKETQQLNALIEACLEIPIAPPPSTQGLTVRRPRVEPRPCEVALPLTSRNHRGRFAMRTVAHLTRKGIAGSTILVLAGCGTYQLASGVMPSTPKTQEQQQLGNLGCKDRAKLAANTTGRQTGAFLLGMTIVGAPVAFEMEKAKQREVYKSCMEAKGYRILPPNDQAAITAPASNPPDTPQPGQTPPALVLKPAAVAPASPPAAAAPATPQPSSGKDEAAQLQKLKAFRDKGLTTEEEYEKKRKEILDRL